MGEADDENTAVDNEWGEWMKGMLRWRMNRS